MTTWFPSIVVTRKREELSNLLQTLIKRSCPEGMELPEIDFPTKDGNVINTDESFENAFDEDYAPDKEEMDESDVSNSNRSKLKGSESSVESSSQEMSTSTAKKITVKKRTLDKDANSASVPPDKKTPKLN